MRNFSWNCFAVTGNIDAYLLYKDTETLAERREPDIVLREKEKEKKS
ncbi:hypothetical protein GCM10007416_06510 [Kroppenstedtia guangzhouensis]|uniref:YqzL-like protein n=1 Tax=Kroppenstedtia guangzhouensis TaxID=1274356 RepID=A0ABQ1G3T6_9BACL|nr:YqzL family protein [Kroppenstedtia guangzhouensis]GGA36322.1 hypothetical protein GCM10007416_06510 [Kroppenstedtia guangzhouensis]